MTIVTGQRTAVADVWECAERYVYEEGKTEAGKKESAGRRRVARTSTTPYADIVGIYVIGDAGL